MVSLFFALLTFVNRPLIAGFGPVPTVPEQVCSAGDFKYSFKAANHGKWVLANGGLKSGLPAAQQATATSLGIGANLPDARDRAVVGASATKLLNTTGGAAAVTLTQANLPNINLVGGNHNHGITDPGHTHGYNIFYVGNGTFNSNGSAGSSFGSAQGYTTGSATTGISVQSSGNLTIPLGGSGTAIATQDPYFALNGFICL
jgi:hypothetical protein